MASFSKLFSGAAVTLYLSLFAALASASPIGQVRADFENILAEKKDLIRRQGSFRAITGAQDGRTCPRLSLRAMQNNPDQWALYLMATDTFKNMDQNAVFSYFDVAKVHGVPAEPWDGVQGNWNGNTAPGYCTHSNPVFPPWHRVYVALYEQAFLAAVQATINQFRGTDRQRWQNAANCMRVPYWDWAQGPGKAPSVVPDSLTAKYVTLPNPSGGTRTIINPIFRYDMHPLDPSGMAQNPWAMWPTTLRYPTRSDTVNTYSQNNLFVDSIQNQAQSLKDQVYNIFTQCSDYMQMANDAAPLSNGCSISLESVHNTMHNSIGGSNMGHMTYLWWAAFDPAFWIHHANVDRLFSMWQVIYPNNYITGGQSQAGTYSQPVGTYYDGNTALDPFHHTDGSSWTSNQARDINTFHYTYPEVQEARGSSQAMINIVNRLYGNGGARRSKRDLISGLMDTATDMVNGATDMVQGTVEGATDAVDNTVSAVTGGDLGLHNMTSGLLSGTVNFVQAALPSLRADLAALLTPTGRQHDYTANVAAQRFGLGGSFNIYIFFGEPEGDASNFGTSHNMVGVQGVFANPGMNMDNLQVTGAVPLTSALVAKINSGELESLDEEHVGPYLRANLKWRVVKAEGTEVPVDKVPGFKVGIVRSNVTPAEHDSSFPMWHGFETVSAITDGHLGGLDLHKEWDSWDKDDQC